jgi:serine phosphatase RsbU (regulator of sigma subunit)
MEARVAVAKIGKYASSESGDTLEMVERPTGGISFVLADGQTSGKSAKAISNVVARKAISLLAEGVRDGAAARAASDYLYTYRAGKVLATLNILSIDLLTRTIVIVRNNPSPVFIIEAGQIRALANETDAVGMRRGVRPAIEEIPLTAGLHVIIYTDGLAHAGSRAGKAFEVSAALERLMASGSQDPEAWANQLLEEAVALDQGRPGDDISVLVAIVADQADDETRRLRVQIPLP